MKDEAERKARELFHDWDDMESLEAAVAAALREAQAPCHEQLHEWIKANGPGGWIDELRAERDKWLAWSGGQYPDDSPGDVIHVEADGTIILDDGITTWNPLRALKFIKAERDALVQQLERATMEREQLAQTYDKTVERLEREIVQLKLEWLGMKSEVQVCHQKLAQLKAERDAEFVRGLERALTVLHDQMARGWDGSMILMYRAIQAEIEKAKAGK